MAYRDAREARQALVQVARCQGGYVTARQAKEAGYGPQHLAYHVRAGNLERVGHGLYRLPELPSDEHDDLVRLALWSRDRQGVPRAVVSHQTALALHGLADVLPRRVHLSVPRGFRKPTPTGCVLHTGDLDPSECQEWSVFSVTTPLRTLGDVAASSGVSREQLALAVEQALERGLVRVRALRDMAEAKGGRRLREVLEQVARR